MGQELAPKADAENRDVVPAGLPDQIELPGQVRSVVNVTDRPRSTYHNEGVGVECVGDGAGRLRPDVLEDAYVGHNVKIQPRRGSTCMKRIRETLPFENSNSPSSAAMKCYTAFINGVPIAFYAASQSDEEAEGIRTATCIRNPFQNACEPRCMT